MEKIYVVTECGNDGIDMFSIQLGVYSTLEKAQARMVVCFFKTKNYIEKSDEYTIIDNGYDVNPMETTLLFRDSKGRFCKHFVVIEERTLDEDGSEIYFELPC